MYLSPVAYATSSLLLLSGLYAHTHICHTDGNGVFDLIRRESVNLGSKPPTVAEVGAVVETLAAGAT
jgi:hypothetical protein